MTLSMHIDLKGRISNTKLPYTGCLMPLFEAIVNSIHAIEDVGGRGTIHVTIERDQTRRSLKVDNAALAVNPIRNFIVQDDGVGFTDENLEAFLTSDTRQKASRGGKGVGRFLMAEGF
jgi:hypothetical protein